jgi:tetratricopeptide (TPR) repeat protein
LIRSRSCGAEKSKNRVKNKDSQQSDAQILQWAERAVEKGKWKDALNHYRALEKRQGTGSYADKIIEIQLKRYEEFIAKAMFESAKQLLENIADQLSPDQLKSMERIHASSLGDTDKIVALCWETLEAQGNSEKALDPVILEELIFSESEPPTSLQNNPAIADLIAIRTGLKAVCTGSSETLERAVSSIPRRSPLASWKLLLRALDAWYAAKDSELDGYLKHLRDLPPIAQRISDSLKSLRGEASPMDANRIQDVFAMHGMAEAEQVEAALKIDALLKDSRYFQAHEQSKTLRAAGKAHSTSLDQGLTEHLVSVFKTGNPNFVDYIEKSLEGHEFQQKWFPFVQAKFAKPSASDCDCRFCVKKNGELYLEILERSDTPAAVLAYAHAHYSDNLLTKVNEPDYDKDHHAEEDCDSIIKHLNIARTLDPASTRAGLKLFDFYSQIKDHSSANKLIDQLAKDYPDDASILQMAARRCRARGTVVRAVQQIENALSTDPHLPELKQDYIKALFACAKRDFEKNRIEKARDSFAKMRPYLQPQTIDLDHWLDARLVRLRQFELETSAGVQDASFHALQKEVSHDWRDAPVFGKALRALLSQEVVSSKRRKKDYNDWCAFFESETVRSKLTPKQVLNLLNVDKKELDENAQERSKQSKRSFITRLLKNYLSHIDKERLEGILPIFWVCPYEYLGLRDLTTLCRKWSKLDREHPQLKLLVIRTKISGSNSYLFHSRSGLELTLSEVEKALEIAYKRDDLVAIRNGKVIRQQITDMLGSFSRGFEEDYDEDDDDDYRDDDYRDAGRSGSSFGSQTGKFSNDTDDRQKAFDFGPSNDRDEAPSEQEHFEAFMERWMGSNAQERKEFEEELTLNAGRETAEKIIKTLKRIKSMGGMG